MNVVLAAVFSLLIILVLILLSMLSVYVVVLAINYIAAQAHWDFTLPTNFLSIFCIALVVFFVANIFKRKSK